MRIKGLFTAILFFSFAFFICSCSNSNGAEIANLSDENLREITDERENAILWTRELEAVRLTRNYKVNQMVSSKMILSPEAISFANTRRNFIYPSLDGFGSLDTSAISSEMRDFLSRTCSSISKWNLSAVKMSSAREFSLILFKYDVEHSWKSLYKKPFPEIITPSPVATEAQSQSTKTESTAADASTATTGADASNEFSQPQTESQSAETAAADKTAESEETGTNTEANESAPSSDSGNSSNSQESTASATTSDSTVSMAKGLPEPEGIFSSWLYGCPFFDEDIIEVPVRFYSSEGILDIILYVETDANFSVSQIEILRLSQK